MCYSDSPTEPDAGTRWRKIRIPATVESRPQRYVWFKRRFRFRRPDGNKRIYLHFDGVKYACAVFLNGREVGGHFGGWEPFEIDVTDTMKGGENVIAVRVEDVRAMLAEKVPYRRGRAIFRGMRDIIIAPVGSRITRIGIWQDVYASIRHPQFIDDVFIKTSVRKKRITVSVTVKNDSNHPASYSILCR